MLKREKVLLEILSSEISYTNELNLFFKTLLVPLKKNSQSAEPVVNQSDAAILENSIESILQAANRFLRDLQLEHSGRSSKTVGQIFVEHSNTFLKLYLAYVTGYHTALDLHDKLYMAGKKQRRITHNYYTFVRSCLQKEPTLKNRNFPDFYILPIQRIPRYRLLLKELYKYTNLRFERENLREAIERICYIAEEMNYRLRMIHFSGNLNLEFEEDERTRLKLFGRGSSFTYEPSIFKKESRGVSGVNSDSKVLGTIEEISESQEELHSHQTSSTAPFSVPSSSIASSTPPSYNQMLITKEEQVASYLRAHGWGDIKNGPSKNVFSLLSLIRLGNPWKSMPDPLNLKQLVQGYTKMVMQTDSFSKYSPKNGDIVVFGPFNSGVSPVLDILVSLQSKSILASPYTVLDQVGNLDWEGWDHFVNFSNPKNRIFKTHSDLIKNLLEIPKSQQQAKFKVIILLRNPADLRLSYFRSIRRAFKKLNPEYATNFDDQISLENFATSLGYYENFIYDILKLSLKSKNSAGIFNIFFYEDLVANTKKFVEKLATFTGLCDSRDKFLDDISNFIQSQANYPRNHKMGNTNRGRLSGKGFSKSALQKLDSLWEKNIYISGFSRFTNYERTFCLLTKQDTYPFATPQSSINLPRKWSLLSKNSSNRQSDRDLLASALKEEHHQLEDSRSQEFSLTRSLSLRGRGSFVSRVFRGNSEGNVEYGRSESFNGSGFGDIEEEKQSSPRSQSRANYESDSEPEEDVKEFTHEEVL